MNTDNTYGGDNGWWWYSPVRFTVSMQSYTCLPTRIPDCSSNQMGRHGCHFLTVTRMVHRRLLSRTTTDEKWATASGLPQSTFGVLSQRRYAELFQWLLPRSQRALFEPRFSEPQNQFSFYQAPGGYGNSYGMHAVPPPGKQIRLATDH